jgi:hypothetical protein
MDRDARVAVTDTARKDPMNDVKEAKVVAAVDVQWMEDSVAIVVGGP